MCWKFRSVGKIPWYLVFWLAEGISETNEFHHLSHSNVFGILPGVVITPLPWAVYSSAWLLFQWRIFFLMFNPDLPWLRGVEKGISDAWFKQVWGTTFMKTLLACCHSVCLKKDFHVCFLLNVFLSLLVYKNALVLLKSP